MCPAFAFSLYYSITFNDQQVELVATIFPNFTYSSLFFCDCAISTCGWITHPCVWHCSAVKQLLMIQILCSTHPCSAIASAPNCGDFKRIPVQSTETKSPEPHDITFERNHHCGLNYEAL